MTTPIFIKSPEQNFVRSPCQARTRQTGAISMFSIVCARMPLWGFGTFATNATSVNGFTVGGAFSSGGPPTLAPGSPNEWWPYNVTWPAVYNTLTEQWTETYGSLTTVTAYSPYVDLTQPAQTVTGPSGTHFSGAGTITGLSITPSLITVNYTYDWYNDPSNPLAFVVVTGVYTATLSGSILNPSGTGPFDPGNATYGWAAMTASANALLADSSIPAIGTYSSWTTIDPISTSPGYRISTNYFNSCTLWEDIGAAANGFPTGVSFDQTQHEPPSILDWPKPSPNTAPGNNEGACMCMKSTWNLNGAGWGNNGLCGGINNPPSMGGLGQVMNDHANIFAQTFNIGNFNSPGAIALATTFPNPIAWPKTVTFAPSDVLANTGGAGTYGLLGFQAGAG